VATGVSRSLIAPHPVVEGHVGSREDAPSLISPNSSIAFLRLRLQLSAGEFGQAAGNFDIWLSEKGPDENQNRKQ
jgi:hypothetical protein